MIGGNAMKTAILAATAMLVVAGIIVAVIYLVTKERVLLNHLRESLHIDPSDAATMESGLQAASA